MITRIIIFLLTMLVLAAVGRFIPFAPIIGGVVAAWLLFSKPKEVQPKDWTQDEEDGEESEEKGEWGDYELEGDKKKATSVTKDKNESMLLNDLEEEVIEEEISQDVEYEREFKIKTFYFEKILSPKQKIISSVTIFTSLLIIALALSDEIYMIHMYHKSHGSYINLTWYVWICFILTQAYIQNKIWSEKLIFKTRYLVYQLKA